MATASHLLPIGDDDIKGLLSKMGQYAYKTRDSLQDKSLETYMQQCIHLASQDYKVTVIPNGAGDLCTHYPSKLMIFEYEVTPGEGSSNPYVQSLYDSEKLKDLFKKARFARCRERFPVPVILFRGKHVMRSATLSVGPEMYTRSGLNMMLGGGQSVPANTHITSTKTDWQLFDKVRGQDIRLLQTFNVHYIADLMVENKKVKFLLTVSSSEKVDKEKRYAEFQLMSLPYPGCEFFREWKDNHFKGEGLKFDWTQSFVDTRLDIPDLRMPSCLFADWKQYQTWDVIQLTQNYLKLLLSVLKDGNGGMLVHCISGWDRTPLFISLIRLSLWADGLAHTSLSPHQMLFFTLAYDWLLFGHNLPDRVTKGEEIFFFCFDFLKHIVTEDFSIKARRTRRCDSLSQVDILLDGDGSRTRSLSSYGSNTSLSSAGSVSSTPGLRTSSANYAASLEDAISGGSHGGSASGSLSGGAVTSNPISVPCASSPSTHLGGHSDKDSSVCSALSCGSWQVLSGTGSVRETHNDWAHSSHGSGDSSGSGARLGAAGASPSGRSPPDHESRAGRLMRVREMFVTSYHATVGQRASQPQAGAVASLIGKFKSLKSTYV